jgi:hypothetical protein
VLGANLVAVARLVVQTPPGGPASVAGLPLLAVAQLIVQTQPGGSRRSLGFNPSPWRGLSPQPTPGGYACLVSQKILAISSILASSCVATSGSVEPLAPLAPASLVASLKSWCSSGYFSKCAGLK